jgi:predicted acylesterase/phospholipase RssA
MSAPPEDADEPWLGAIQVGMLRGLFEDVPIPLHVVAVDVVTGEELLLSAGPLQGGDR